MLAALRGDDRQLPRPPGPFPDLRGIHQARIPLDRCQLRHHHLLLLHLLRDLLPLRGQVRGLDGNQEGIPDRHRRLVARRVHARRLRLGGISFPAGHLDCVCLFLPPLPRHPRPRRVRQLPGRHQGDGRIFPEEGPRLRDLHLQRGRVRGRAGRAAADSAPGRETRLGVGLHHHRRSGLHLDVLLGLHVREAREESARERGGAGVYSSG